MNNKNEFINKLLSSKYKYYFISLLYIKYTQKLEKKIIELERNRIIEKKIKNDKCKCYDNDENEYDFVKNFICIFTKLLYMV
jgi:hypothetical protein